LGLQLRTCLNEAAEKGITLKGIMLGSHGLFTWGDTAFESYVNTLGVKNINRATVAPTLDSLLNSCSLKFIIPLIFINISEKFGMDLSKSKPIFLNKWRIISFYIDYLP
jgi:hypothetical protein